MLLTHKVVNLEPVELRDGSHWSELELTSMLHKTLLKQGWIENPLMRRVSIPDVESRHSGHLFAFSDLLKIGPL